MESAVLCVTQNLVKMYKHVPAVQDVNLTLYDGEIVSIIGPSGAGKTSLLKLLAGLATADAGSIHFPHHNTAQPQAVLVFQDFLLFPNMTVADNVGFGLRSKTGRKNFRLGRGQIKQRSLELLQAFGILDKADAYPGQLSAGQQQRAAIARALAIQPELLLLDEPFSHLDKNLKMETALFLRKIIKEFNITAMTVTHDLDEAMAMSDRTGVMIDGRLEQLDTVEQVYMYPRKRKVAELLGPVNSFTVGLLSALHCSSEVSLLQKLPPDTRLFCRAENLRIKASPTGNALVKSVIFTGQLILYTVELKVENSSKTLQIFSLEKNLQPGNRVEIHLHIAFREEDTI
ncbi:ABC transporter ATP-binding protein [Spirochaeta dissipatitropha]